MKRRVRGLLIVAFVGILAVTVLALGMGYYYLSYRNALMHEAISNKVQMSVDQIASDVEHAITRIENSLLRDIAFSASKDLTPDGMTQLLADHPAIATLLVEFAGGSYYTAGISPPMAKWLQEQAKEQSALPLSGDVERSPVRHFSGVYGAEPVQAGYWITPDSAVGSISGFIYTFDLSYVRSTLLPNIERASQRSDSTDSREGIILVDNQHPHEPSYVVSAFEVIFPFWRVAYKYDFSAMERRSNAELLVYSGIVFFVLFFMVLSAYFIGLKIYQQQRLVQLKSEMVSHVSHDLKTPLSLIRMYTETLMLQRVYGVKNTRDYYQTILSECDHLHLLINNNLDFSCIEKGMKKYCFTLGRFSDVIAEILSQYGDYIKDKGFDLTTDIDADIPGFSFDQLAMSQVVINLLDNAIKFSPVVKVILMTLKRVDDTLEFKIQDSGIGIGAKDLQAIFEPYKRLSNLYRGSGIGLPLVKHTVEAHGGSVSALSNVGVGTVILVSLPLQRSEHDT